MRRILNHCLLLVAMTAMAGGCSQSGSGGTATQRTEWRATSLSSFEGNEDPVMKWVVSPPPGHAEKDDFVNITDEGGGVVRMFLRYRGEWWDGDQTTSRKDRQRAEIKGLGPHQKNDQTFEYAMTWRTNDDFTDPANETTTAYDDPIQKRRRHFCHVFQLKAVDGSDGPPMITMSVEEGNRQGTVDYWAGQAAQPTVVRTFAWKPGEWHRVAIRVTTSLNGAGAVMVSVDGDEFKGIRGVDVYRPLSTNYRPKWGLYRAAGPGAKMHDDWVEHKEVTVRKF